MVTRLALLLMSFFSIWCYGKETLLYGENTYEFAQASQIWLFDDQTFATKYDSRKWGLSGGTKDFGRYLMKDDTLFFDSPCFGYLAGRKAVLKDNFIEYLDGKTEFKIEIKKSALPVAKPDLSKPFYSKYSLFTYVPRPLSPVPRARKAYDLKANEVAEIDRLLVKCISDNAKVLRHKNSTLLKQCIAAINTKGEKVVWVNCLCNDRWNANEFKYGVIVVEDGGSCYFSVMINLSKGSYSLLKVNGEA